MEQQKVAGTGLVHLRELQKAVGTRLAPHLVRQRAVGTGLVQLMELQKAVGTRWAPHLVLQKVVEKE